MLPAEGGAFSEGTPPSPCGLQGACVRLLRCPGLAKAAQPQPLPRAAPSGPPAQVTGQLHQARLHTALLITALQAHEPSTKKELTESVTTGKKPGLLLTKKNF